MSLYKSFFSELYEVSPADAEKAIAAGEKAIKKPNLPEDAERVSALLEKNIPTSPEKWARAKSAARSKFKVYPSAYANLWASKKYKSMGGGWKKGKS